MKKVPFISKEKAQEINKDFPTPFIFMMKREFARMRRL